MDALSDVLKVAHLTGGVFLHAEFFAPWCIASHLTPEYCAPVLGSASHLILYHYIVEGGFSLRIERDDGEALVFGPGDVVLLPRNDLHLMGSDLSMPPVMSSEIIHPPKNGGLFSIRHGGNGACTRMVFGFLGRGSRHKQSSDRALAPGAQAQSRGRRRGGMDPLDFPICRGGGGRRPPRIGDCAGQVIRVAVR